MTPAARIAAVIEALDQVEVAPRPADAVISAYFRDRRYIGSKDRSAIAEALYTLLRHRARLRWWLERSGWTGPVTARATVIAERLLLRDGHAAALATVFSGGRFAPAAWDDAETRLARALDRHTLDHPAMPEQIQLECPDWAEPALRAALGERFAAEMAALLEPAAMDLRVNPVKTTREAALTALRGEGIIAEPTRWSPLGIRVQGRPALAATETFRNGLVEIQDEGSQLVALIADAQPGQQVVDFCAGAGGKALAMAAAMANKGRVVACDVLGGRLKRAAERLRRAGLFNVETRELSSERDPWVKHHKGMFDRVLVDAPCSGTGTWRRNPDQRWRRQGPDLGELRRLQAEILDSAARLAKPGGRVIYATCSLLLEENEVQIESFLGTHPDFVVRPITELWGDVIGGRAPVEEPMLRLSPGRHGTDGFFAAVLERVVP
ncbi:MAG: RsmB/NOP family class I SAM-dependent RNA methyltransferase [Azospirillaceae bacterium]|nr:RsmB/NOP family class I SAM-dependent RNA methyltransferase [Azospirillaceae bacterium]